MAAQHACAERVEGAKPYLFGHRPDHRGHPHLHLPRGLVGEGHGKNVPGLRRAGGDELRQAGALDEAEAVYAAARELFEAHERRVRGGLAANLLGRAIDGNVGFKKPRRVIK